MGIHRRRKQRRIGVPRGMLRHLSLQILKQRPMSGSEIVDQIEDYTDWRPSPGSIYPMLSDLQEVGFIKSYEDQDPTLKRFTLTELGVKSVEDFKENDDSLRNRQRTIRKMYWRLHLEMPEELYSSFGSLINTFEEVYTKIRDNPKSNSILGAILQNAVTNLKEIEV